MMKFAAFSPIIESKALCSVLWENCWRRTGFDESCRNCNMCEQQFQESEKKRKFSSRRRRRKYVSEIFISCCQESCKPKTRKNASTRSTRDGFQHGWSGFHMQEISENPFPSVSSVTNYRLICDAMARHANFHFSPGLVDDFFFDVFRPSPRCKHHKSYSNFPQIIKKHSIHATSLVAVANERDRLANNVFRNIWLAGWQPRKIITRKREITR